MAVPELPHEPVWVDSISAVQRAVQEILKYPSYALDTEFASGSTYRPVLALVQISVGNTIYLIDAIEVDIQHLRPVFESPATMIVHAGQADLELLVPRVGCAPTKLLDTQIAASLMGFNSISLASLVRTVMDIELDKTTRMTDWTQRPLLRRQRHYAASDVLYLEAVAKELTTSLDRVGRSTWLVEECERLRLRDYHDADPNDAWMRLKGAAGLGPVQRSRAQALAAWREARAAHTDRIPSRILADDVIVDIARQAPGSRYDLAQLRRLRGHPDALIDALWTALGTASATAPPALPDQGIDHVFDPTLQLLVATAQQLARDHTIDPAILATRNDITQWIAGRQSRLDTGWRAELVGTLFGDLRHGRLALRLTNGGRGLEVLSHPSS